MKGGMPRLSHSAARIPGVRRSREGWTLIEILVATAILACLSVTAIMCMTREVASANKRQCLANLQMIESAKNAWVADHPGQDMPADPSALKQYLRGGSIPTCPRDGSTYQNLYDPTQPTTCTCPYHNQQAYDTTPTPTPTP